MVQAGDEHLPYERQEDTLSPRMCGAAALCMVLRSFGLRGSQAEVWARIAPADGQRCSGARAFRLGADALRRGLAALTVQVRQPWWFLEVAAEHHCRVILSHRLDVNAAAGHYSVLVGMNEEGVTLHDPQLGPARFVAWAEFLKLWRPGRGAGEVRGNVAVAVGRPRADVARCTACGLAIPPALPCPACGQAVPLQPGSLLGCPDAGCAGRTWELVFCPWCDAGLRSLDGTPGTTAAPEGGLQHA